MNGGVILAVAAGGLIGAPARFLLERLVADHVASEFPWGTFLVNVSGSLLLGLLTGLDLTAKLPPVTKALAGTGFCGAYTTFSTWTFETVRLIENGELLEAAANALVSLAVGIAAAAAGLAVGMALG
ncbi:MAG: fluoride efflux transporter CrcB [Acidimicrobiales bacterium]